MTYQYNCNGKVIDVWRWGDINMDNVSVFDGKAYERSIHEDENGKFFTWNKTKIYLDDWIRSSMKDLKDRVDNNEWITSEDLCKAILSDGVENVRFSIPVNNHDQLDLSDNPENCKDVLFMIKEEFNREVVNNYKVKLYIVDQDESNKKYRDFYTDDLVHLIRDHCVKIVVEDNSNETV